MTTSIQFLVERMADMYALEPLYNSLDREEGLSPFYTETGHHDLEKQYLAKFRTQSQSMFNDILTISNWWSLKESDIWKMMISTEDNLTIDESLLRNMIVPKTEEEKSALKLQYKVPADRPVVVVGYSGREFSREYFYRTITDYAELYLIGTGWGDAQDRDKMRKALGKKHIHFVTQYGHLRNYFAMADIALYRDYMEPSDRQLHNFVEATENGVFFLAKPRFQHFGYQELRDIGLIEECTDLINLELKVIKQLKKIVNNPSAYHEEIRQMLTKRELHLKRTTGAYLPVLHSQVKNLLGLGEAFDSELVVVDHTTEKGNIRTIKHMDTGWIVDKQTE